MVQKAVTFVDQVSVASDLDKKLELIDTLRTITEGKVNSDNLSLSAANSHCSFIFFL